MKKRNTLKHRLLPILIAFCVFSACVTEANNNINNDALTAMLLAGDNAGIINHLNRPDAGLDTIVSTITGAPTSTYLYPGNDITILPGQFVYFIMNESMDPATLTVNGTMALEGNAALYSFYAENDTIAIFPQTAWNEGMARTLVIDCKDVEGEAMETLTLTYDVVDDTTAPAVLSVSKADGSSINYDAGIRIVFSESMTYYNLQLTGSMAAEANVTWASTNADMDTVTLTPKTFWTDGPGKTLNVDVTDLANNPLPTLSLTYTVIDSLGPSVTSVNKPHGSFISSLQSLTVEFSESIDPATLVLDGTMAGEVGSLVWSATNSASDTVTITPAGKWTKGDAKNLIISATDTAGNAMAPAYELSYSVLDGVVHVSPAGDDANPGTEAFPMKSIRASVDRAVAVLGTGELHLAGGNYVERESVRMKDGIVINGGYSPSDWDVRDTTLHPSILDSTARDAVGFYEILDGTITSSTILDGMTLNCNGDGNNSSVTCVNVQTASPIIRNNIMHSVDGGVVSLGANSSPVISGNTIYTGSMISQAVGIKIQAESDSNIQVLNNTVFGGNHPDYSCGINVSATGVNDTNITVTIQGNTSHGGTGGYSFGFRTHIVNEAVLNFLDNTVYGQGGSTTTSSFGATFRSSGPDGQILIQGNTISGGIGSAYSHGLSTSEGHFTLVANRIYAEGPVGGTGRTMGHYDTSRYSILRNNLITGGNGYEADTVYSNNGTSNNGTYADREYYNNTFISGHRTDRSYNSSTIDATSVRAKFENNIFIELPIGSGNERFECISAGFYASDTFNSMKNNNFYGCKMAFHNLDPVSSSHSCYQNCTVEEVNSMGGNYSGNVSMDPAFVDPDGPDNDVSTQMDNDYRLSATTPAGVTGGGFDFSLNFTDDLDGVTRTVPWSMGAYEF